MLKVYTKVGDQGKTKQVTGKMVAKYDPQIQTLGALDELQSWLGVTVANLSLACRGLEEKLIKLEREMYELQADLVVKRHHTITLAEVTYMEEQIDAWTEELPEMKEFILPAGQRPAPTSSMPGHWPGPASGSACCTRTKAGRSRATASST